MPQPPLWPAHLHHFCLRTAQIDAQVEWYGKQLEMEAEKLPEGSVWLTSGQRNIVLSYNGSTEDGASGGEESRGASGDEGWCQATAVLTLRNPSQAAQTIALDAQTLFELPVYAPKVYTMTSPYAIQRIREVVLTAGERGVSLTKALSYLASMPSTVVNTFYREHIL